MTMPGMPNQPEPEPELPEQDDEVDGAQKLPTGLHLVKSTADPDAPIGLSDALHAAGDVG